jgi:hypothetical protein
MKIRKSKETLILTQIENAILSEALEILRHIYSECEAHGVIEECVDEAKDSITYLLDDAEIEGDELEEGTKVTITI